MRKVLPLLLLVLLMYQCTPTNNKKKYVTPLSEHPEQFTEEYISQSAKKLVDYVPDHKFNPAIKPYFSEKYYKLLEEAWSIANANPDNYDENEWLFYFISGNDDMSYADHTKKILETAVIDDWNVYAKMEYLGIIHDIVMHYENGDWVISNFDGTLDRLDWYVKKHRGS